MQLTAQQKNTEPRKSTPELVLQVEDLRYKVGITSILKGINFQLHQGETLGLLGPNGAGKSTLLKCLVGILPSSGASQLFGSNPRKNIETRKRIGYVGHETFLYSKLSAGENLRFYASLYQTPVDVQAALEEFQLSHSRDQLVETFSRGMKQRLALARSLLSAPELILMDEPFTGLDQQSSELLQCKMKTLEGKVAFVIATHELERAFELAQKFLILRNGRQVFFGGKAEMESGIQDFYREKTT